MQLIVADLDGSIIDNNKISTDDIQSIAYWISKGNSFTISTGRPLSRTIKFINQLKINFPVVLCNGAAIYTADRTLDILGNFNISDIKLLLNLLEEEQVLENAIIYYEYTTQLLRANQQLLCKVAGWDIDYICIDKIQEIVNEPILMISFYSPSFEIKNCIQRFSKLFNIECLSDNYIDILPMGISKGDALKKILRDYVFDDIYVIADSINDLSMIFCSNRLVAVKNAIQEVRDKSYMIIASNKDNPVSDLINEIRRNKYGRI